MALPILFWYGVYKWITSSDVPEGVHQYAAEVNEAVNIDDTDDDELITNLDANTTQNHARFAAYCGRECRNKFMFKSRSAANEQVAHKFIYDYLTRKGVRSLHISHILPIAIEVAFTPTEAELLAKQYRVARDTRDRVAEYNRSYTGLSPWERLFGARSAGARHGEGPSRNA